jgi:hypothetical protein
MNAQMVSLSIGNRPEQLLRIPIAFAPFGPLVLSKVDDLEEIKHQQDNDTSEKDDQFAVH